MVEDLCWFCFFVIGSVILVFILLVVVWDGNDGYLFGISFNVYIFGFILGVFLGFVFYFIIKVEYLF